jgi:transcriptional regulator with PAS, ATPase and Fis domain
MSSASTVLIQGESGTGKELVARAIHRESARRDHPFISVNCSIFPGNQLEAELFGYEKGTFPDAMERVKGYLEHAQGGTIFLDEIADLNLNLQAKLLRVIQENIFSRMGGVKNISADIRLIAATRKNLENAVRNMEFREDLYFRFNIVRVELPPLRQREDDFITLMHFFIEEGNRQYKKKIKVISKDVIEIFRNYNWPGNVRELKNIIERIMILSDDEVLQTDQLPREFIDKQRDQDAKILISSVGGDSFRSLRKRTIEEFEMSYIQALLRKNKGDIVQSAVDAKLGVTEFKKLVKKYYIAPDDFNT